MKKIKKKPKFTIPAKIKKRKKTLNHYNRQKTKKKPVLQYQPTLNLPQNTSEYNSTGRNTDKVLYFINKNVSCRNKHEMLPLFCLPASLFHLQFAMHVVISVPQPRMLNTQLPKKPVSSEIRSQSIPCITNPAHTKHKHDVCSM